MADCSVLEFQRGGFVFDNCARNAVLEKCEGFKMPKAVKTGTTIVGVVFQDGVVLGADTRATEDTIVADKVCKKIHYIAPNMYCCGAGTAADTEMTTKMISAQLELHSMNTGRVNRVCTANRMLKQFLFRYQGHVSAALVLGGVDPTGPHLYSIHPHGSTDCLPYVTMGSGSLAAMAVFEARYKSNMNVNEAVQLVNDAICAGIFNDLGSGSNVDVCIITKDKVELIEPFNMANVKGQRQGKYDYPKGATEVISEEIILIQPDSVGLSADTHTSHAQSMDTGL